MNPTGSLAGTQTTKLKRTMFREYDIRGRETPDELSEHALTLIGRAYGTFLRRRSIARLVAGRDSRATSAQFHQALIEGLVSAGCEVLDIGMVTTPMLYWSQYHFQTLGGAMVTASHNPAGWNGVKMAVGYSLTTNTQQIQEIYDSIEREDFVAGQGRVVPSPITDAYVADVIKRVKIKGHPRVLLNTGNGTAAIIGPRLLREAGCDVVELHTRIDPTFPHYTANPSSVEMMEDTGEHVCSSKAQLGLAIDADGDRLGITDETGKTVWPDLFMIPLIRDLLKEKPGAKIIFDVKCSATLEEDIANHGGVPIMWKTGHSYIKEKLAEEKAELALEGSGHIFVVHGYYGFDDALFAGLKLIEALSHETASLSQILETAPRWYASPVYNAYCDDAEKYKISQELTAKFKKDGHRVIELSGARVTFDDGWGLVRPSSNLPQLVLRFEAKTPQRLSEIEEMFRNLLKTYPGIGTQWVTG
jgi:phosphomannomutase / phosphoglucomutase